jgi:threonine dehydratase
MGQREKNITAVDILKARKVLNGVVSRTPLAYSKGLSEVSGAEVHVKWENLQKTGSYKPRGAYYRMNMLTPTERRKGVITISAGNFAIGVAWAAHMMGVKATIVVPENAAKVKIQGCRDLGAEVIVHGRYFDEANDFCKKLAKKGDKAFVSGEDEFDVYAGHGTVGYEILEDLPEVETIIVPVGGGGLATGVSCWAKTVNPSIRIVGVQSTAAYTLHDCFKAGKMVDVPVPPTICEGLAGGITQLMLDLALQYFDDIVLAEEEKLKSAILWVLKHDRQLLEGSAVVGPAALLQGKVKVKKGEKVAVVATGGNIDLEILGLPRSTA